LTVRWLNTIGLVFVLACVVLFGALLAIVTINAGLSAFVNWVFALPAQWLNTIGLVLGIAGVLIIFRWGPPQPDFDEGVSLGLEADNVLANGKKVAEPTQWMRWASLRVRKSRCRYWP
jgi:hypothetical protein